MDKEKIIELACEAYCKCCDTKECQDLGEFAGECDMQCDWVQKFKKKFKNKLKNEILGKS